MSLFDLANACFEGYGAFCAWKNVKALHAAKKFQGVSIDAFAFFAIWGYWNCFYYPHLDQWFSFAAGLVLAGMNTAWVALALYYTRNQDEG